MYHTTLRPAIDEPWLRMEPVRVGPVPSWLPTADAFLTVERNGEPFARVDVYAGEWGGPFAGAVAWGRFVAVGLGRAAHLVDPVTREAHAFPCDGYFGYLYPAGRLLLVASATELIAVDEQGEEAWRRGDVGIDGVVVHRIEGDVVEGEGEWDPPGGWEPFRVSLATGERL